MLKNSQALFKKLEMISVSLITYKIITYIMTLMTLMKTGQI